ncbi:MAG: aminotransferase class IV [Planctomycetota bacterium]
MKPNDAPSPRYFAVDGARAVEFAAPMPGSSAEVLEHLGAAAYEGVRTYDGSCFFSLAEHLRRLAASCHALGGGLAFEPDDVHRALVQAGALFRIEHGVEARVRIDVCRGPLFAVGSSANVVLTLSPFRGVEREHLRNGVHVATTAEIRRERAEVKDSHWTLVRERHIAASPRLAECYEPMLVDADGRLLEGVQSNLVFVRNEKLWTAPQRVLRGVTRDAVLELSPEEPVWDYVSIGDLRRFDEAFLTSSVRGVVPIVRIDEHVIGSGRPGPVTREMMTRYEAHVEEALR